MASPYFGWESNSDRHIKPYDCDSIWLIDRCIGFTQHLFWWSRYKQIPALNGLFLLNASITDEWLSDPFHSWPVCLLHREMKEQAHMEQALLGGLKFVLMVFIDLFIHLSVRIIYMYVILERERGMYRVNTLWNLSIAPSAPLIIEVNVKNHEFHIEI